MLKKENNEWRRNIDDKDDFFKNQIEVWIKGAIDRSQNRPQVDNKQDQPQQPEPQPQPQDQPEQHQQLPQVPVAEVAQATHALEARFH